MKKTQINQLRKHLSPFVITALINFEKQIDEYILHGKKLHPKDYAEIKSIVTKVVINNIPNIVNEIMDTTVSNQAEVRVNKMTKHLA